MAARNHVTRIQSADAVAKEANDVGQKAKADLQKADPVNAKEALQNNEIDGNGSGIKFTTKAAKDAEKAKADGGKKKGAENPNTVLDEDEKKGVSNKSEDEIKDDASKDKDTSTEEHLQITNPATSAEHGGVETTKQVKK